MKKIFIILVVCLAAEYSHAQEFGLSFSYFIPRNGDISTPISPFSFRGVGVSLNKFIALETGITLYRMSGLNLKDVPFTSNKSLVGPNFTFFVPGEIVFQFPGRGFEFDIKGGGFVFYGANQKLNYGNIDRAIREMEKWDIANSQFTFKNRPGYGVHGGVELDIDVNSQFGISLEVNYLVGASALPLSGSYSGGMLAGPNETKSAEYEDAKVDFTGLEVSIGVFMKGGGGGPQKKRRR
ncbi:MAG TPA: hypothetical protein VFE50_17710 [Cyclobacteriaceae bacterium]|nr:hypothetical protein [Cyclobacteriaceae bacterium]